MAEPLTGMRGTKYSQGTETSLVRDVSDKIFLLQPDDTPLLAFINGMKGKKAATNPKFEWFEDDLIPPYIDCDAAGTGTTINVDAGQGTRCRIGDILIAPNGENLLITNISTDALTVTRALGTTPTAYNLLATDQLIVAGNALAEGSDNAPFRYTKKEVKTNYIQIFKDSVEITEVQNASESYGGDDRTYQRRKKAIEHKRGIEQAFLFGNGWEDVSGTQAIRGTRGLVNFVSTNVTDVGGVVTENEFETFLRTVFTYHPSITAPEKLFLCGPVMLSALNFWAKQALRTEVNEKTYGCRIAKYMSAHGDLNIAKHPLLMVYGTPLLQRNYNFVIDPLNVKYRFLTGLDTKLYTDTQAKYSAKMLDEYRTYAGLQVMLEKTHGLFKNVTGYAS
jgi:hypothetical protein